MCMHICVFECMLIYCCIYVYCVCKCICVCLCLFIYVCMYMYLCICVCMFTCVRIYVYMCVGQDTDFQEASHLKNLIKEWLLMVVAFLVVRSACCDV